MHWFVLKCDGMMRYSAIVYTTFVWCDGMMHQSVMVTGDAKVRRYDTLKGEGSPQVRWYDTLKGKGSS